MTKILIVDDEVDFTNVLQMNLQRTGRFDVRAVNESSTAISAAIEFEPDIILLDVVMPGIDGGDLSARIRDHPKLNGIPIIIVSALVANAETADDAVAMSGDQIIVAKPVRMTKLLNCIDYALADQSEAT